MVHHRRRINLAPFKSSVSCSPLPYGVWLIKARLDNNPLFNFVRLTGRICIAAAAVSTVFSSFFFRSVFAVLYTHRVHPAPLPNPKHLGRRFSWWRGGEIVREMKKINIYRMLGRWSIAGIFRAEKMALD